MRRRWLLSAMAVVPLASCSVSKTTVPAHVTLFGPRDRVAALVTRLQAHDPALRARLGAMPQGQAKAEFDLVQGAAFDAYADLRDAHGFRVSYVMPRTETRIEVKDPLCVLLSGGSACH